MYKKLEYQNDARSLHDDASKGINEFFGRGGKLLKQGNTKLGDRGRYGIMVVASGLAWHDCPGRTEACAKVCYAMGFTYMMFLHQRKGPNAVYSYLAHNEPQKLLYMYLYQELTEWDKRGKLLRTPIVVRIHEAGDFVSADHVDMWFSLAVAFPDIQFYGYSHSFRVPAIADRLRACNDLPNVVIRNSYDQGEAEVALTDKANPVAFVDGSIKGNGQKPIKELMSRSPVYKGVMRCAEQITGGEVKCTDCGICWNKPKIPVQFYRH